MTSPTSKQSIPKRIALVGPLPPPAGGMANQTVQLAALLRREGLAVELVQVNTPYRPAWIGKLRGVRALFRLASYIPKLWTVAGHVSLFHVMANSDWSWHLLAAPAIWISWLRGTPVVVNYRGGRAEAFFRRAWPVVRLTLKRSDVITVPSPYLKDVFACRHITTVVVPNIIDLSLFRRSRSETEPSCYRKGHPHLVVARNLEPIYDIATALRAFSLICQDYPGAHLTVAGAGPERHSLESLASELGISQTVTFTGSIANKDMAILYREADLVLNPSRVDNMPISILEALASGVPVVSTNVGGIPHLVQDGQTALLVPPQSPFEMARAALTLLRDSKIASFLTDKGRAYAEQFAWRNVRERLFDAYRLALAGSQVEGAQP